MVISFKIFMELLSRITMSSKNTPSLPNGMEVPTGALSNTVPTGASSNTVPTGAKSSTPPLSRKQRMDNLQHQKKMDAAAVETKEEKADHDAFVTKIEQQLKALAEEQKAAAATAATAATATAATAAAAVVSSAAAVVSSAAATEFSCAEQELAKFLRINYTRNLIQAIETPKLERKSEADLDESKKEWESELLALNDKKQEFLCLLPKEFLEICTKQQVLDDLIEKSKSSRAASDLLESTREYRVKLTTMEANIESKKKEVPLSNQQRHHNNVSSFFKISGLAPLVTTLVVGDAVSAISSLRCGFHPKIFSLCRVGEDESMMFEFNNPPGSFKLVSKWNNLFPLYSSKMDVLSLGKDLYYCNRLNSAIYNLLCFVVPSVARTNQAHLWEVLMNESYFLPASLTRDVEILSTYEGVSALLLTHYAMKDRKKGPKETTDERLFVHEDVRLFLRESDQNELLQSGISSNKSDWKNRTSSTHALSVLMTERGFKCFESSLDELKKMGVIEETPKNIPSAKNPDRMAYEFIVETAASTAPMIARSAVNPRVILTPAQENEQRQVQMRKDRQDAKGAKLAEARDRAAELEALQFENEQRDLADTIALKNASKETQDARIVANNAANKAAQAAQAAQASKNLEKLGSTLNSSPPDSNPLTEETIEFAASEFNVDPRSVKMVVEANKITSVTRLASSQAICVGIDGFINNTQKGAEQKAQLSEKNLALMARIQRIKAARSLPASQAAHANSSDTSFAEQIRLNGLEIQESCGDFFAKLRCSAATASASATETQSAASASATETQSAATATAAAETQSANPQIEETMNKRFCLHGRFRSFSKETLEIIKI